MGWFKRERRELKARVEGLNMIASSGSFLVDIEREEDNLYIIYEVEVYYEYEPGGGDNINEPVYPPRIYVHDPVVMGVNEEFSEGRGSRKIGSVIKLSDTERQTLEDVASDYMREACYRGDEDG